jgi:heme-degrading monooxygenase HmoA
MSNPLTLINAFEVPERADEQFVSAWYRARTALEAQPGYGGAALHRSVAPMTPYRFVNIGQWESLTAFTRAIESAGVSAHDFPFPAHPGLYEVIAATERLTSNGTEVVLINPFEVEPEDDEQFIAGLERANEHLRRQSGYLSNRLHRSVQPTADFRFVDIARWTSAEAFLAAIRDPAFRAVADFSHPAHPGLYTVAA